MVIQEKNDIRLLPSIDAIWASVQNILAQRLPEPAFNSWIRTSKLVGLADGEVIVAVTNPFMRGMVMNYIDVITEAFAEIIRAPVVVQMIIDAAAIAAAYSATIASITIAPDSPSAGEDSDVTAGSGEAISGHLAGCDTDGQAALPGNHIARSNNREVAPPGNSAGRSNNGQDVLPGNAAGSSNNSRGSLSVGSTVSRAANVARTAIGSDALNLSGLNNKYTFDTFVVGSHNRFCHSAAQAVAAQPAQSYNPLFIYSGVGLGKTHLMQAIGHQILASFPHLSVRYISCERFTNELINSIRDDKMATFRKRYRQVDVLLVDDIQFIQGKESTQEEFFYTFNALRDSSKQIIISSDRPPKAFSRLEERLKSRFEWGLIADMQAPDFETRLAILRKKCEVEKMQIPGDVLEYIANVFSSNIRELEGALIRVLAYSGLVGSGLNVATVARILQPVSPAQKQKPLVTLERLIDVIASRHRVEPSELRSSKRSQDLVLPRHIAMYLAHELLHMSFPRIGQSFGNRKHTSALYASSRIKEMLTENAQLAESIRQITSELGL